MNFKRQNSMSNNNNTPPPWSEAPPWAMWRAQDSDGAWYWFKTRPTPGEEIPWWIGNRKVQDEIFAKSGEANLNWKETREKRPKNEPS